MKAKPHVAVIGAGAFGGGPLCICWRAGRESLCSMRGGREIRDLLQAANAGHAGNLWARSALHRNGGAGAALVDEIRAAMEAAVSASHRRALDGGRARRRVRARVGEMLRAAKIKFQELSAAQMKKRWPQINFEGIQWGIFEPECGYLEARASCQAVVEAFVAAGGKYRQAAVMSDGLEERAALRVLRLSDGSQLQGRRLRFCLRAMDGKVVSANGRRPGQATKQDVFFFGLPRAMTVSATSNCRCGRTIAAHFRYGIPGSDGAGSRLRTTPAGRSLIRPRRAGCQSGNVEGCSRICRLSLPCPERRAAGGNSCLPVRADADSALHRRSASGNDNVWLVGRRLGSWLQARAGDWGVGGEA